MKLYRNVKNRGGYPTLPVLIPPEHWTATKTNTQFYKNRTSITLHHQIAFYTYKTQTNTHLQRLSTCQLFKQP